MAISAKYMSKLAALRRQWWRLHMSENFSSGTRNSKQANRIKNCALNNIPVLFSLNGPFKKLQDLPLKNTLSYISKTMKYYCKGLKKVNLF